ncbi:MAG: 30S ribosomal protein S8 [Saccharofermentanales bacterium]|jgi:small subunit ribosomal protein S8
MQITDTIADMLTRIRNAGAAGHPTVEVPASNLKKAIAQILQEEGYISKIETIANEHQGVIRITLKYAAKKPVITGIKRISRPGLRVYAPSEKLPKVLGGLGIAIVSTSQGIMTDRKARQSNVGGEVLAYVW